MIADIKIGITGLPGSGKTYALLRVIEMLKEEELSIGGMIDEPVGDGRHKTGFTVRDLATGETAVFASTEIESKVMVGKIGVDLSKLEEIGVRRSAMRARTATSLSSTRSGRWRSRASSSSMRSRRRWMRTNR